VQNTIGSPLAPYVLVTTQSGKTRTALVRIWQLAFPGCKVLTVEPVMGGPYIIARIEATIIDFLARAVFYGIQEVPGVLDVEVSLCCDKDDLPLQGTSRRRELIDVVSVANR
jgi:hypothetical protein